jgi:hypothetical protein
VGGCFWICGCVGGSLVKVSCSVRLDLVRLAMVVMETMYMVSSKFYFEINPG